MSRAVTKLEICQTVIRPSKDHELYVKIEKQLRRFERKTITNIYEVTKILEKVYQSFTAQERGERKIKKITKITLPHGGVRLEMIFGTNPKHRPEWSEIIEKTKRR